ncbi:MAG TPA: hypothetical protein VGJ50_33365 [Streptosporangiaceae bacterium]
MPTADRGRRPPAHAGKLRPWERFTITLVFTVVAAAVVAVSVYGSRTRHPGQPQSAARPGSSGAAPAVPRPGAGARPSIPGGLGHIDPASESGSQVLAAALTPVLRRYGGGLAVGVADSRTGTTAVYGSTRTFRTASIVKADILAALLLQHQQANTKLSDQERASATEMMDDNDENAATTLWTAIGGAAGLRDANRMLHLSHTTPGAGGRWGHTSTTAGDQLQLLADLTSTRSPLSPLSRSYELGLMRHVSAGQGWGVTAAGSGGSPAVKNGWMTDSDAAWVVNSIGVITHAGHTVLVAVLSDDQASESAGISADEAAAKAAVSAIIRG